jgi:hypothetical protein
VQLDRVDLTLPVGASLNLAGGADQIADTGERMGTQALANVDRGQPSQGDALRVSDDEVGVSVAIGVDALDEGDPTLDRAAAGKAGGAMGGSDRFAAAPLRALWSRPIRPGRSGRRIDTPTVTAATGNGAKHD